MVAQWRQARRRNGGEGGGGVKAVSPQGGAPFIASGGGVSCGRSGGGGEAVVPAKWQRPRSERGQHGWPCCLDKAADGWGPTVSDFFNLSQTGSTLNKNKMGALSYYKNSQFLHAARQQYWEQHSQLWRLQISNRSKVKNPVTDSVFESLLNFKRDSNLQKNLINCPKFLLDLIFTKVNLVVYTCM
jgi:hypothetical protein